MFLEAFNLKFERVVNTNLKFDRICFLSLFTQSNFKFVKSLLQPLIQQSKRTTT